MKSQPECGYDSDNTKCHKCTLDHKGCFWDGLSQMGQVEKRLRTLKKTADAVVDLMADSVLHGYTKTHGFCAGFGSGYGYGYPFLEPAENPDPDPCTRLPFVYPSLK